MPIRPIDIMKTQEASQIKHMESQRTQHAQDQISKSFQTTIKQEQYKPGKTTQSDNHEYRYDAKEKGNNQYGSSGKKKQNNEQEEKKETKDSLKRGNIDILI